MDIRGIWFGKSPSATILRILLLPFSGLYWLGWKLYAGLYRLGLKHASDTHRPVIVVGNFTVGGTGKTPVSIFVVELLHELGYRVVCGCSGYGSPHEANAALAPEGVLNAEEWGDEPSLIRSRLPEVPLIVGRNRVAAAQLCHQRFPDSVLLMDDGLQHLPLKTHLKIVLKPATMNSWVLPAGPYREPNDPRRADLMLPGEFNTERRLDHLMDAQGNRLDLQVLHGTNIDALAAIGHPESFFADLEAQGAKIRNRVALGDHDDLADGRLLEFLEAGFPLVITEKDWTKLKHRQDIQGKQIWVAHQYVSIEPRAAFAAWLHEKVEQIVETKV